jgi:glutaredoxin 3
MKPESPAPTTAVPDRLTAVKPRGAAAGQASAPASAASKLPVLYVKTGCPWCTEVIDFLGDNGVGYREKNVSQDAAAAQEMERISGQTKAPVLDWHGRILADFGVVELKPFLQKQNVKLEDS